MKVYICRITEEKIYSAFSPVKRYVQVAVNISPDYTWRLSGAKMMRKTNLVTEM